MPLTFNILRELFNTAEKVPQKVALVLEDQVWTYGELIEKVNQVVQYLNRFEITQGQIIYQFVERSLEMVCGILGIICAGGVYCSLNPADPLERLISLIDQTQGQFVMLHEKTRNQFPSSAVKKVILYEEIFFLSMNTTKKSKSFACNEAGAAYIICTSGTTGQQKAIIHTHESLSASVDALIHWNVGFYSSQDQVLQIAACSWAMHLLEIFPILVLGGTLVLMRAGGQLNMTYFSRTLFDQQITTLTIGAGMARALINYAEVIQETELLKRVCKLCVSGESMSARLLKNLLPLFNENYIQLFVCFGLSECNTALGRKIQDLDINDNMIPAGYPLPGYRCLLIDEHEEVISYTTLQKCSAIGQICLGGPSVFNCYLNDPQRTATTLITINSEAYIKTGDLGYYNSHGEVVPAGRTDFQIKIRGQRVEAAEIENTIIASLSNEISSCLVMKSTENEERLIAYLVSKNLDINIESIRKYCNTHLRQYMIPSHFVVLDSFPVNTNGKIDRKRLPPPSPLSSCTSTKLTETYEEQPVSELEEKVHRFWCTLLHLDAISRDANCFALGGSSLSIMQLFNYYQVYLAPHKQLNVLDFIVNPTIVEHVRHLKDPEMKTFTHWNALNLVQGPASYAQMAVWLAERTRFVTWPHVFSYTIPITFQINSGHFSIKKCLKALDCIVAQHSTFRTRLIFNKERGCLYQSILGYAYYYPVHLSTFDNENERILLIHNEVTKPFDTEHDGVFRCHFIRGRHTDEDAMSVGDIVIFNFHHGSFDGQSRDIFLKEFKLAYSNDNLQPQQLQYIDYAVYERTLSITDAQNYWRETLRSYGWDRKLELGAVQKTSLSARRTGQGSTFIVTIPLKTTQSMIAFTQQHNTTLFQLGLTCFYLFLNQFSCKNRDACIGVIHLNRHRPELVSMLGMLANILPCRISIDSLNQISFIDLLQQIQKIFLASVQYAYLPYDELIALHRVQTLYLQFPFIQTLFRIDAFKDFKHLNGITLDNSCELSHYSLPDHSVGHKFDLIVSLGYDNATETIECKWHYMLDVFELNTISMHAMNFVDLLTQLFDDTSDEKLFQRLQKPLNELIAIDEKDKYKTEKEVTSNIPMNTLYPRVVSEQTEQEQELLNRIIIVFSRILNCAMISIDINKSFFEQGGTSLKALQALTLLQDQFSTPINTQSFFDHPTADHLAQNFWNDQSSLSQITVHSKKEND